MIVDTGTSALPLPGDLADGRQARSWESADTPDFPHPPALYDRACARYLDARRARIDAFVQDTYSFASALNVHRHALGWDIARAPVNALLAGPQVGLMAAGWGISHLGGVSKTARRLSNRLMRTTLIQPTDVTRELTFRLYRDFLELPYDDGQGRQTTRDALREEILADPALQAFAHQTDLALTTRIDDPAFRTRLAETLAVYTGTRAASADIVTSLTCLGIGVASVHGFTPGAWGLTGAVANAITYKMALSSAPIAMTLGLTSTHAVVPAAVSAGVLAGTAACVMGSVAVLGAFSGIIADPVQKALGWHRRRLERLVDVLEMDLRAGIDRPLTLRDHYTARVFDAVDLLVAIRQLATGPA